LLRENAKKHSSEAERVLLFNLGLANWSPPEPLNYSRKLSALSAAGRWDSQFHLPKVDDALTRLAKQFALISIGSLGEVTNGNPVSYSDAGAIPIVRSGDLVDIDDDARFLRTSDAQGYFELKRGDVLISSIGFGSIGKVQVFDKPGTFGTVSEVTVIRQDKLDPYFLAAYLRSQPGQLQIDRWITGATGQLHLYPRDVKRIQVPLASKKVQASCRRAAEDARESRKSAKSLLDAAKRAVEIAIEDSEKAALRFLEQSGGGGA
jgi:type I restriction enzyme M protein